MTQIAIIGHKTRGKEVIEILEMLGYINLHNYVANCDSFCFYGGKSTNGIYYDWVNDCFVDENVTVFTLEEFLEKYPYKIGDKVTVTGLPEYPKIINFMEWFDGDIHYSFDNETWFLPSALNLYKEETMDKVNKAIFDTNAQCCDISNRLIKEETMEENLTIQDIRDNNAEWLLNKLQEMSVKKVLQTISDLYDKLRKPQYPKTYAECCDVLSISPYYNLRYHTYERCYNEYATADKLCSLQDKLNILGKLLICRDAYWKIAGEQMGLGKPWEPNWLNEEQDKFVLYTHNNVICSNRFVFGHNVFAFPTAEMRDAFYENFKDLIESCKKLL